MKDHIEEEKAEPYSLLMCIALLLIVGAATQLPIHALWF
jgi:hypothetical protein